MFSQLLRGFSALLSAPPSGVGTRKICEYNHQLNFASIGVRSVLLRGLGGIQITTTNRVQASTFAGTFTGALVGSVQGGRGSVLPGAVLFGLSGFLGQHGYELLISRQQDRASEATGRAGFLQRLASTKLSPMKALSNEEYAAMLREKVLQLDVEIAMIDDNIRNLSKAQTKPMDYEPPQKPDSGPDPGHGPT